MEISGYTREELIGKPHNLVRHPDMPQEAFQDLWDTLNGGKPWLGLVKNRRKDGAFYWVLANVMPIYEHGKVTGYASVRLKPSADQIAAAQEFYDDINQAISQMDGVTHKNATLVHDLGGTVKGLTIDADNLRLAIEVLNTGTGNIEYNGSSYRGEKASGRIAQSPPFRPVSPNPALTINCHPSGAAF